MDITTTTKVALALAMTMVSHTKCLASASALQNVEDFVSFEKRNEDKSVALLRAIDANPGGVDAESRIVDEFLALPFGKLPASRMPCAIDFGTRLKCLERIVHFEIAKGDDSIIASIASRMDGLVRLPTDRRLEDMAAARNLLLHLCYTAEEVEEYGKFKPDGKTMRGALLTHPDFDVVFAQIRNEYDARERYNRELEKFKKKAAELLNASARRRKRL